VHYLMRYLAYPIGLVHLFGNEDKPQIVETLMAFLPIMNIYFVMGVENKLGLTIPSPIRAMKPAGSPDEYGLKRSLFEKAEKVNSHRVFAEAFVLFR